MSERPPSKWVRFDLAGQQKPKTQVYDVSTKDDKGDGDGYHEMGQVRWWGPFRRYSFFPHQGTLFESQCLRDIAAFCDWLMAERKRRKP